MRRVTRSCGSSRTGPGPPSLGSRSTPGPMGRLAADPAEHDLGSLTEREVLDQLAVSMAGRTAEILVAGATDVASASDLRTANAFALRAVREWGFSDRGPVTSDEYVDAIVEADVDRAVGALLADAERRAGEILHRHRPALDALTERLMLHRAGSAGTCRSGCLTSISSPSRRRRSDDRRVGSA